MAPTSNISLPSNSNISTESQDPSIVNEESISKLQNDLGRLVLKFKKVPGSQEYVTYQDIKKFPQAEEES